MVSDFGYGKVTRFGEEFLGFGGNGFGFSFCNGQAS
jgi:hypothetical protein